MRLAHEQAIVPLRDRVAELVGLGAAFAVNCLSSLEGYIKSAEAAGVTDQEILEIAKLAAFIKGRASDCHIPWSDRGHCAQAHQGDAGKSRWPWNSRVKVLPRIGFLASDFTRWSSVSASSFPFPSTHGRVGHLPLDRAPP